VGEEEGDAMVGEKEVEEGDEAMVGEGGVQEGTY
jgi:hypothetical protein